MLRSTAHSIIKFSEEIYRLVLFLYPPEHRREYGSPMVQLFRDQIRESYSKSGARGIAQIWVRTLWDLLTTVPEEHMAITSKVRLVRISLGLLAGFAVLCVYLQAARPPAHAALRADREVSAVAISPDDRAIVAGTLWGGMQVWDASTRQPQHKLAQSSPSLIYSLNFSPDGHLLASSTPCGLLGCVQLWDAATGELVRTIEGHARGMQVTDREGHVQVLDVPGDVGDVCFGPDGRLLASAGSDGAIELRDVSTGQLVREMYGHTKTPIHSIAFSPDGRTLAASQENTVLLWGVDSSTVVWELARHADLVSRVAFSHDGNTIASAGFDRTIVLWDARSGRLLHQLEQDAQITSLAFSPDGRVLASGDQRNRIWLWNLESKQLLRTYRAHRWDPFDNGVGTLAFSADGGTLVSGGEDGRVVLWAVSEG